jgi:uncharacterized protein YndB with AHSA1/START domain
MAAKNKPNELYITRIYDAPVKMVWDAWVDPKKVAKRWGPRGFTLTSHSKDVKTGGTWSYTMHGPDGVDYPNTTKYLEVEKYKRMVYDHGGHEDRPPLFRVTVDFIDLGGKTKMEMTMALATAEAAAETKKFIKKAGGDSTWDRLAEYLSEDSSGKDIFVINRTFEAPLNVMFEMFTDPKHFSKWLAPIGMEMKFIRADIKPGGSTFYYMEGDMGQGKSRLYGKAQYLEIKRPNHLKYTQQFCDEKENITRHPMAPTWPETMLTTVTLNEESPSRTRVTVQWEVHGDANTAERETFNKAKPGMSQGWGGSFEKLEEYLKQV